MLTVSSGSGVNATETESPVSRSSASSAVTAASTAVTSAAGLSPALIRWICCSSSVAAVTFLPAITVSRMLCSSSRLCCNRSSILLTGSIRPSSILIRSASISWLRLPIADIPDMRAPPFNVCRCRFSSSMGPWDRLSLLQLLRAWSAASSNSAASSEKIAAISASYPASSSISGSACTGNSGAAVSSCSRLSCGCTASVRFVR